MGLALFLEDQAHQRTYAGPEVSLLLESVFAKLVGESLLAGIHPCGDTMFNSIQLGRVCEELDTISRVHPESKLGAEALRATFESVIRNRGYVWVSGD